MGVTEFGSSGLGQPARIVLEALVGDGNAVSSQKPFICDGSCIDGSLVGYITVTISDR